MHPLLINLLVALCGWLAFNVLLFSMEKDLSDDKNEKFKIGDYAQKVWDNWLASLVMIPVLLSIGYLGLDLSVVDIEHLKWTDLYYLCAGFATELVKQAIKRLKKSKD